MVGDLTKNTAKLAFVSLLALVAVIAYMIVGPILSYAVELAKKAVEPPPPPVRYLEGERLREAIRNNRIEDKYDERWWGKKLTKPQRDAIERAWDAWMADTERDGSTEAALIDAVRKAGINVTNFPDAVHAANHLLNHGPTRILVTPETPEEGSSE